MQSAPLIFISHLSEEQEAAIGLKSLLLDHFGDKVRVFVSSDDSSIRVGEGWLESVSSNLRRAAAEIVLCSPESVNRPWIQFEAGAGWIRNIPVMPVCIGGMTPRNLEEPMRRLQAVDARITQDLKRLIQTLSATVSIPVKRIRCEAFAKLVQDLELRRASGPAFPKLYAVSADIHNDLPQMIRATRQTLVMSGIHFNISLTNRFEDYLNALASGVSIRICAVRPESDAVRYLAEFLGEDPDVLKQECSLTYAIFEKLKKRHREKAAAGKVGRLELRLLERPPAARAYLFDHQLNGGQILFTPYLQMREAMQTPTLLFHNNIPGYAAFAESILVTTDSATMYYNSAAPAAA